MTGANGVMIQSVQRAAQILDVLGSGTPRLGVTEIADRLGLAKPTVHGLLRTLEAYALVAQDQATGSTVSAPVCCSSATRTWTPPTCGRGRCGGPRGWPSRRRRRSGSPP